MKFKSIFILFNVILVFAFAFIFFMPFAFLGAAYSMTFWSKNWPLFLFFVAVITGFNAFFMSNWKMFRLLESEDWDALATLLEDRVYKKKHYDRRTVRLLVNTCLLKGDMAAIERVEASLREHKPSALRRDAVLFGAARLLKNDAEASVTFLSEFADAKGVENPAWIVFYYGFALVLSKRPVDASPRLEASLSAKDPVLALLSAYVLGTLCAAASKPAEKKRLIEISERKRLLIADRYKTGSKGVSRWAHEIERAKSEIHIVILSKILDEASTWLLKP
jgi:hypothetical protein